MTKLVTVLRDAMDVAYEDLCNVNKTCPNEVLPKEEQIRCSMYKSLCQSYKKQTICVERGYPIQGDDYRRRPECDFWFRENSGTDVWVELKRAWCVEGWAGPTISVKGGKARSWADDVKKLKMAKKIGKGHFLPPASGLQKAFLLYAFTDHSILSDLETYPKRLKTFMLRVDEWLPKECPELKRAETERWTYDFNWLDTPITNLTIFLWIW